MTADYTKGAVLSECRKYRYQLWRIWDISKPLALFVMLNPSTADENEDDRTIKKLIRFSRKWGYGGFYVGNLFAYRAKDPKELKKVGFEVAFRPDNITHIFEMAEKCELKILAHGNPPIEAPDMREYPYDWHYLKLTKKGNPYHPLYLKEDLVPVSFSAQISK